MTMASKTREKLLDVARQLFASNGVEKTTMNDIATASDKGRRTIYTYFKNKREIYEAVIERESEVIVQKLRTVVISDFEPTEKLRKFIEARFDIVEETIRASTTSQIISFLTFDYKRLERIRALAVTKEQELILQLLNDGIKKRIFDPIQSKLLPGVYQMIFQGFDYCNLRGNFAQFGLTMSEIRSSVIEFLMNTIIVNKNNDRNFNIVQPL